MAGLREPPPLFDDEDSRKDEESDIFASAVQSPMSDEGSTPTNEPNDGKHPLAASPDETPVAESPPHPKIPSQPAEDLFETCGSNLKEKLEDASLDNANSVDQHQSHSGGLNKETLLQNAESPFHPSDITPLSESHERNLPNPTNITNNMSSYFLNDSDTTEIRLDDASQEISLDDDNDDDLIPSTNSKLQIDSEPAQILPSVWPSSGGPQSTNAGPSPPFSPPQRSGITDTAAGIPSVNNDKGFAVDEKIEKEEDDSFLEITVSDPQKIGDGIGAYMSYKVTTKTNVKFFRKKHWSVTRRFSDFLGLHSKLVDKHLHSGVIIPPAPEKAAIASTKIKLGSDKSSDSSSSEFLERRRAALERYMNRTASHPTLRADPDFREFLELDTDLPKATQTSAISSAGVMRLFNKVGETVNKMTFKMEESDQWYEEKTQQVENLDAQLRKLHTAIETLVGYRRELAHSTASFSKSAAVLSSVEEHSALSRALHQLAEATERVHTIHHAQADADFFHLSETIKDYINIIGAVKEVFHERVKTYQTWQHSVAMLGKKRENKAKAELSGRIDKVEAANEEVREWEAKVDRSQEEFERISKAIKTEMEHFDVVRISDYKDMIIKYLEALVTSQQQVVKVWETFLPEAKAIA